MASVISCSFYHLFNAKTLRLRRGWGLSPEASLFSYILSFKAKTLELGSKMKRLLLGGRAHAEEQDVADFQTWKPTGLPAPEKVWCVSGSIMNMVRQSRGMFGLDHTVM